MRKPYFAHAQTVKLARLLDMDYKPAELAEEISVNVDTVYRSYIPAGCPHERDKNNRIWINGVAFTFWVKDMQARKGRGKKNRSPMPEDQAFCMRCKTRVEMVNPKLKYSTSYLEILQAHCPICGGKINRARAAKRSGARLETPG